MPKQPAEVELTEEQLLCFGARRGHLSWSAYALTRFSPEDTTGIMLSGGFGHARYQSITVYDDQTGNSVAALRDNQTVAGSGSKNPYLLAVDRDTPERDYSIAIVPEGSYTANFSNAIVSAGKAPYWLGGDPGLKLESDSGFRIWI